MVGFVGVRGPDLPGDAVSRRRQRARGRLHGAASGAPSGNLEPPFRGWIGGHPDDDAEPPDGALDLSVPITPAAPAILWLRAATPSRLRRVPIEHADDTRTRTGYLHGVTAVRRLLAQRRLAAILCAATLLLKLLVPTGYMIGDDHGRPGIVLCSGVASPPMAMPGMHGDAADRGERRDHGKAEMPCAFSGLSTAVLAAVDPVQLAALIVFVMAVRSTAIAPPPAMLGSHLRPPLRGPPPAI